MRFSRWDALGNSYLVAEPGERLKADEVRREVGDTDGIVEVLSESPSAAEIVIWNPDGSTAELSGNGTRIAARWLAKRTGADAVTIRVGPREVRARMLAGDEVEQELGEVAVGPAERIEVAGEQLDFVPVSVGNPHAVVPREPTRDDLLRLGPLVERHPRFPERTNVQLAHVTAPGEVTAMVWERGAGETAASGTSAVAVAAALVGEGDVLVRFPGGDLRVRLADGRATLIGPAVELPATLS
jgi:diaminopimelate epimerase